ncbi:Polysaccharide biosynthesis/export protein [Lacunisphaera limnophila]|uniref:Polysaccharide biosynthesis/export protein n=1 Tax=Lacunisphaera limnophila TaxID=1838286 RepID=A0A1D8AZI7_9BACT|nr:polysaccharide biosynthesis/export family protein [Lacunisphaera limnophila]AOS46303.1 Polysaccharide biosynthesis/export protein [Lacunisphaera limnophila]
MKRASVLPLFLLLCLPALAQVADKKNYVHTLALADRVRIAVFQEDDLTSLSRVDARGRVNLPLIGEIAIGGLTVVEAQAAIENAYKEGRYLRNPQVTVSVEEYAPREVSIQGRIRNAGRYTLPIESTLSVVELVTKAGGIDDIGKGSAVTVTRIMPDGSRKVFTVDVDSVIKGKKDSKSDDSTMLLQPGDIVYVPERLI